MASVPIVDADHPSNGRVTRNGDERWMRHAACRMEDVTIFFAQHSESGAERLEREARAKAVCAGCEVRRDCLVYALRMDIRHGVWGGLSEKERAALRRRAKSAAPSPPETAEERRPRRYR